MIRQPAVAGSFYPADSTVLAKQANQLVRSNSPPIVAKALIAPHAGYMFSGAVAGELFAATEIPPTVIMLGPNHHGRGATAAVTAADSWATPLGAVPVVDSLRSHLCDRIDSLEIDETSHQFEHSLEVMLPLLLQRQPQLKILPIALRSLSLSDCLTLGSQLATELAGLDENFLLLASSDMNHFLDAETTAKLDSMAIQAMTDFNPQQLYETVIKNQISMCGVLPAVTVMQTAKDLGASHCRLLRYAHSGEVNGDNSRVVGYAALTIS